MQASAELPATIETGFLWV